MANSLDWFPFFASDFLHSRAVRNMTAEQVGIYIRLLCWQWEDGLIPEDVDELADMAKVSKQCLTDAWGVLGECFVSVDGGYVNSRLRDIHQEQIDRHQKKVSAGRKGGKSSRPKGYGTQAKPKHCLEKPASKSEANRLDKIRPEDIREEGENPPTPPRGEQLGFDDWWTAYPKKVDKKNADKKYKLAIKNGATAEELTEGVKRYVAATDPQFIMGPAKWLGGERWKDEQAQGSIGPIRSTSRTFRSAREQKGEHG